MHAGPGQHDRGEPGAGRRRLAAGRAGRDDRGAPGPSARRRGCPVAAGRPGRDAPGDVRRDRLPGHRHAVLAAPAAAHVADPGRRRGAGVDLRLVRGAVGRRPGRGTGPDRHLEVGGRVGPQAAARGLHRHVRGRRARHPGLRGALRGEPGGHRQPAGHRPVRAGPVGGPGGQRGAGADRGLPVRGPAARRRLAGHPALVQGQPVDPAGGHHPAGVRAVLGVAARPAVGQPATARTAAHRGPVAVRGQHPDHAGALGAGGPGAVRVVRGAVPGQRAALAGGGPDDRDRALGAVPAAVRGATGAAPREAGAHHPGRAAHPVRRTDRGRPGHQHLVTRVMPGAPGD